MSSILIKQEHIKIDNIKIDGYSYKYLNNIYTHESTEFFREQFHFAKKYREHHDNMLPHTIFWDYLTFKHNLHPKRFDHYHPVIGKWIETPPPIINSIPEPNSMALIGIGIIIIVILKWLKIKN